MYIEWDESFSVGVETFDAHHKKIFDLYNKVIETTQRENVSPKDIKAVLDDLLDYTIFHFAEEELAMYKAKYPGLRKQKRAHNELVTEVLDASDELDKGGIIMRADLASLIRNWLFVHIKEIDMEYSSFFRGNQ